MRDVLPRRERAPERAMDDEAVEEPGVLHDHRLVQPDEVTRALEARRGRALAAYLARGVLRDDEEDHERHQGDGDEEHGGPEDPANEVAQHAYRDAARERRLIDVEELRH